MSYGPYCEQRYDAQSGPRSSALYLFVYLFVHLTDPTPLPFFHAYTTPLFFTLITTITNSIKYFDNFYCRIRPATGQKMQKISEEVIFRNY